MKRLMPALSVILLLWGCKQTVDIKPSSDLFQRFYGNGQTDRDNYSPEGRVVTITSDNNLVAAGTLGGNEDSTHAYFFKTDANGKFISGNQVVDTKQAQLVDMAPAGDGSYYLLVYRRSDSLKTEIVRIDGNLQVQGTPVQYYFKSGIPLALSFKNNVLAILGNYNDSSGAVVQKVFLAQLDPDGNILKVNYDIGDNNLNNLTGKSLIGGDDGVYYWCGHVQKSANDIIQPRFTGVDGNGIPRYNLTIAIDGDGTNKDVESELIQTYDKGFVMVGSVGDGITQNIRLIRLNAVGGLQWHADLPKNLQEDTYNSGVSVCEADDGGFVVAGMVSAAKNKPGSIYMARCTGADSVIWEKTFVSQSDDKVSKIIRVDGGYALIGTATRINTKLITIIRTDEEGNIISGE